MGIEGKIAEPDRFTVRRQDGVGPHPEDLECKLCGKIKAQHSPNGYCLYEPDPVPEGFFGVDASTMPAVLEGFNAKPLSFDEKRDLVCRHMGLQSGDVFRTMEVIKEGEKYSTGIILNDDVYRDFYAPQLLAIIEQMKKSANSLIHSNGEILFIGDRINFSSVDRNQILQTVRVHR